MPYGSDYKDRQRHRQRQDTRFLFYVLRSLVTTGALVAIAFAFDVPEKLRAKFWGIPPAAVAEPPQAEPKPVPAPRPQEETTASDDPAADAFDDPPRRQFDPPAKIDPRANQPQPVGKDEVALPERRVQPAIQPTEDPQAPAPEAEVAQGQFLVLDLAKRQMRHPLGDVPEPGKPKPSVRVIGLRKTEAKVNLEPADGSIDEELQIHFPEHPRARILVRVDKIGQRVFLIIEPQMSLWADEPMPLLLKKVKSEAYKARGAGESFLAALATDKARKQSLQDWLNNGRGIPLDQFKQGKAEFAELESSIPLREGQVELVRQGVEELDALERLANELHAKAEFHFEVIDGN